MCGIFAASRLPHSPDQLQRAADRLRDRGPDRSQSLQVDAQTWFAFHRLAIMGLSPAGDQPMRLPEFPHLTLICNGEIYNYRQLAERYGFPLQTGSDCEIVLRMTAAFGLERTLRELDGVFMLALHDARSGELLAARDPIGVRPGFIGWQEEGVALASEAKALTPLCERIQPFPPGHWWSSRRGATFQPYFDWRLPPVEERDEGRLAEQVRHLLTEAVRKRLMSDRPIGALLSGGLDSSLIAGLVAREYGPQRLHTFSIGMPGSIDLQYASQVADFLGTQHHHIELTAEDFIAAIEEVIYHIESYDTTTVRASVGNYLVSRYIAQHTDCKVIFNCDGSDEVTGGYLYLKNAPSPQAFQQETERLVRELYLFDVLRSDRSISANGLEARTPFLDPAFVRYYLAIPPEYKQFDGQRRMEKHLLRLAFSGQGVIPESVLWRRKCAFSDGVSALENSWHRTVQAFVESQVSDEEFAREAPRISHCRPLLKESYYYRKIYHRLFGPHERLIPHFWMPRWTDVIDPSARELDGYRE